MRTDKEGNRHRRLVQNGIENYRIIRYNIVVSCEIISHRESVVVGWFPFFMSVAPDGWGTEPKKKDSAPNRIPG